MRVPHVSADAAPFRSTSVFSLLSSHGLGVSCDDLALLSALISRRARHRFSSAATFARRTRDAGLGGLKKCPRPHSELLENVMTGASTRIWAAFLRNRLNGVGSVWRRVNPLVSHCANQFALHTCPSRHVRFLVLLGPSVVLYIRLEFRYMPVFQKAVTQ